MKFRYKKYGAEILRPVIALEIRYFEIVVPYEVLIDSGADICIFDSDIADILGIDLVKGIRKQINGVTGFPQIAYLHTVHIKLGSREYKMEVGFMNMPNNVYGIVGQKDFFEAFIIMFNLSKGEIQIKPRL